MADSKRALSPEANGSAGALVKKQRTDDGALTPSSKPAAKEVRGSWCPAPPDHPGYRACNGEEHCRTAECVPHMADAQHTPLHSKAVGARAAMGISSGAAAQRG